MHEGIETDEKFVCQKCGLVQVLFLERLVVKVRTLVDREPAGLPPASLDNVIKSLRDYLSLFWS